MRCNNREVERVCYPILRRRVARWRAWSSSPLQANLWANDAISSHIRDLTLNSLLALYSLRLSACEDTRDLTALDLEMKEEKILQFFTAVVMKISIFWNIMTCSLFKVNRRFRRKFRLHLLCWRISHTRNQHETGSKNITPKCSLTFNGLKKWLFTT
jgi:hypothetical protein